MKKLEPNSVEKWAQEAEKVFKASTREMTKSESEAYVVCFLNESAWETNSEMKEKLEKKTFELPCSCVFWNRVRLCHTYTVSVALTVFIGLLAKSFGDVTIYANYLQYQAYKRNQKHLELSFISDIFLDGFPSRESLQHVWNAQKLDTFVDGIDNMLDFNKCQDSIAFK